LHPPRSFKVSRETLFLCC